MSRKSSYTLLHIVDEKFPVLDLMIWETMSWAHGPAGWKEGLTVGLIRRKGEMVGEMRRIVLQNDVKGEE